jgi:hypothetical protein
MAAQQWAAIAKINPEVERQIAQGDFSQVNEWRRENIWSKASTASTPDILRQATGEEPQPGSFHRPSGGSLRAIAHERRVASRSLPDPGVQTIRSEDDRL